MTVYINENRPYEFSHRKEGFPGNGVDPTYFLHSQWEERNGYWKYGEYQYWDWVDGKYTLILRNRMSGSTWFTISQQEAKFGELHNRTLEKLLSQLDVAENLFESWYERQQTYNMLLKTGSSLLSFARNWKKPQYWKKIGKGVKPSSLPEAWLTYQFGVKPLVGTVNSCLLGLGQPLPSANFSARTKVRRRLSELGGTLVFSEFDAGLEMGCRVVPNPNPNVALLNIGGITTPFSTAFSVLPWGWAVDYFVNVSQLLSNFEVRHPGVTIKSGYTTKSMMNGKWYGTSRERDPVKGYMYTVDGNFFSVNRTPTLDLDYKLELKFPFLGSNKAANLFSALALTMKKGH